MSTRPSGDAARFGDAEDGVVVGGARGEDVVPLQRLETLHRLGPMIDFAQPRTASHEIEHEMDDMDRERAVPGASASEDDADPAVPAPAAVAAAGECAEMDEPEHKTHDEDGENKEENEPQTLWARVRRPLSLLLGIAFLVTASLLPMDPNNVKVQRAAGVALLMSTWWITEAVPLSVTALVPVVLFPLMGVVSGRTIASAYFNNVIFVFIGGFLVALAMQRWNLHRRIALWTVCTFGVRPRLLMFGMMFATWFLSMWISNTATTMAMMPNALAVVHKLESSLGRHAVAPYATGLFLGIAYSASLGGTATLIGTPPNLALASIYELLFPGAPELTFARWFVFGLPLATVYLILLWAAFSSIYKIRMGPASVAPADSSAATEVTDADAPPLTTVSVGSSSAATAGAAAAAAASPRIDLTEFRAERQRLGRITWAEGVVAVDFALLGLLWLLRADINFGTWTMPGWSRIFPVPSYVDDGTVAVCMGLLLFIAPARQPGEDGRPAHVLDWRTIKNLPWDLVLLFGGGFALAKAFSVSGLSVFIGQLLMGMSGWHLFWVMLVITTATKFLTEVTSNTATAQVLLPIFASIAVSIRVHPLLLMIAGALSCSYAFMLPVATPPNLIVFGSGKIRIADMARAGLVMNILAIILTTAIGYYMIPIAFGFSIDEFPEWAA